MVAAEMADGLVVECVRLPEGRAMLVVCPACWRGVVVTWRGSSDRWEVPAEHQLRRHLAEHHPEVDPDALEYVTRMPRGRDHAVVDEHEAPTNRAERRAAKRRGRR